MSIEKWTDAFLIFSSIYLKAHPDKASELLHYAYTIRECAVHKGGTAWRTYDEQVRLRQAQTPHRGAALTLICGGDSSR